MTVFLTLLSRCTLPLTDRVMSKNRVAITLEGNTLAFTVFISDLPSLSPYSIFCSYINIYIFFPITLGCIFYHAVLRLPLLLSFQCSLFASCMHAKGHRFISLPSSFQQHTNKYVFLLIKFITSDKCCQTNTTKLSLSNAESRLVLYEMLSKDCFFRSRTREATANTGLLNTGH